MSTDPVASNVLWMAAERARESARPDRLFDDPLASLLAGSDGRAIMTELTAGMPDNPAIPIRTRYFDDHVLASVRGGTRQVVLVAAGMDTRAFRLGLPAGVTVFELDKPDLLAVKEERLAAARSTCERVAVAVDLTHPWRDDLLAAGFSVSSPSVFVAEGLLGYLDEPSVHSLLATAAGVASPGSTLLADVSGRTPSFLQSWLDKLAAAGVPRRFATDDPEGLFASHGWAAEVVEYGHETANFGRWLWPPVDRHDTNWPHNYLVSASLVVS
jgi:methyltransferase (TIGR00027 family)